MKFPPLIPADVVLVDSSATFWIIFLLALLVAVIATPQEDRARAIKRCLLTMLVIFVGGGCLAYILASREDEQRARASTSQNIAPDRTHEPAPQSAAEVAGFEAVPVAAAPQATPDPAAERLRTLRTIEAKYGTR